MFRTGIAAAILMISGCAGTGTPAPTSAATAEAEASLATLEKVADTSCPRTALQIQAQSAKAREAIQLDNATLLDLTQSALVALTQLCKAEKDECGTGPARIGMTPEEAIHTAWCFPDKRNTTEMEGHVREQWIYQQPPDLYKGYLYFDNGRLTAIQKTA